MNNAKKKSFKIDFAFCPSDLIETIPANGEFITLQSYLDCLVVLYTFPVYIGNVQLDVSGGVVFDGDRREGYHVTRSVLTDPNDLNYTNFKNIMDAVELDDDRKKTVDRLLSYIEDVEKGIDFYNPDIKDLPNNDGRPF